MVAPYALQTNLGQRDVEGQVKGQHHSGDQRHEDSEGGILEVGQLHLHRAEFRPPTDVRIFLAVVGAGRWRRLPTTRLPICRLKKY